MRYALSKNFLLPSFSMDILFLFAYQNEILFESLHWNLVLMVISYRKWLEFSYDGNSFFLSSGILFHKHDNFALCVYKCRGSNVTVKWRKKSIETPSAFVYGRTGVNVFTCAWKIDKLTTSEGETRE